VPRQRGDDASELAAAIDRLVAECIAAADVAALTVVMPELVDLRVVVGLALALPSTNGWKVTRRRVPVTPVGPVVAFGVTRDVPFPQGTTLPSEALFLGDFESFPPTRRAPVSALEIFVGEPLARDPKTGDPSTKANLAHIKMVPPMPRKAEAAAWDNSPKLRRESLGLTPDGDDDDLRAKAKVSFVIPLTLAQTLGCAP
jgi:hypothetical protein